MCWVFIAVHRLLIVVACLVAGVWASVVVACGLSSCGARDWLFHGMWDLPGPGLKPVFPALTGRFLTSTPPGNSMLRII